MLFRRMLTKLEGGGVATATLSSKVSAQAKASDPSGTALRLSSSIRPAAKRVARAIVAAYLKRRSLNTDPLDPSRWRLTRNAAGVLCLQDRPLNSLLVEFGSPLHVIDAHAVDANVASFLAVPPGLGSCEVFYSYKTNPIPGLLQRMHEKGIGAEVISEYELWLAMRLGVIPAKIVYNGPVKSDRSLDLAIDREIALINLNSRQEIARVAASAARVGKKARVGMRVVLNDGWGGQFGEQVSSGAAMRAIEEMRSYPELQSVGLHVHKGSEISCEDDVRSMVNNAMAFVDDVRSQLGLEFEILDFGGSLATPTTRWFSERELRLNRTFLWPLAPRDPDAVLSIRNYVSTLLSSIRAHYPGPGRQIPRIFIEPGRAMTANTQMLLCTVCVVRDQDHPAIAICDAGINLAQSVKSEYHATFLVNDDSRRQVAQYRLAGPICTPGDVLINCTELPTLSEGDTIAIMDSGAYFVPFATSFSFPQPAIACMEMGKAQLFRRAERFGDLTALDVDQAHVL